MIANFSKAIMQQVKTELFVLQTDLTLLKLLKSNVMMET